MHGLIAIRIKLPLLIDCESPLSRDDDISSLYALYTSNTSGKGMESRMEGRGQSLRGGAMGGIWGAGTILLICVHLFIYVLPQ